MPRRALEPDDYPFLDYRRFAFSLGVASRGQAWLSGSTAAVFDPAGRAMVVEGGLAEQARLIYDKMAKVLAAERLGLGNITRITQYVAPAALADLAALDAIRRELIPQGAPVVSTVGVMSLLRGAALVEIEAVASSAPTRPAAITVSAEGDPAQGNVAAQSREAYARLSRALEEAGTSLGEVVKTTEYIVPAALRDYRDTADLRRQLFAPPYPAATGVICDALPRAGSQIVIEAVAVLPE